MKTVIMAGGMGTRLSSVLKDAPKPMVPINGVPLLEHLVVSLKSQNMYDITLVVGHMSDVITDYFGDGSRFGVNITYFIEKEPLGTAGALFEMSADMDGDFLLLFGDIYQEVDYSRLIAFHREKKSELTLLTHPNSHPYDSDIVVCDDNCRVTDWMGKKDDRPDDLPNMTNAGIYVVSPDIVRTLPRSGKWDFEKDVIRKRISDRRIFAYRSSEYVKDVGTPDRLESVKSDILAGICEQRRLNNKQKCIFLDRDGTINKLTGYVTEPDMFTLYEHVAEAIRLINRSKYLAIVVTNQPIIARGDCTRSELDMIHRRMHTLLGREGAYVDGVYYCPHHPDKGFDGEVPELKTECKCRKPRPGLLLQAAEDFNIDLSESWMIGDSTADILAGRNAGTKTALLLTGEAGKDGKYKIEPDKTYNNLIECIRDIV